MWKNVQLTVNNVIQTVEPTDGLSPFVLQLLVNPERLLSANLQLISEPLSHPLLW